MPFLDGKHHFSPSAEAYFKKAVEIIEKCPPGDHSTFRAFQDDPANAEAKALYQKENLELIGALAQLGN